MMLWGGRFETVPDADAAAFNNSIGIDWRLAELDVRGSIAWAAALAHAGILTNDEAQAIQAGLQLVEQEIRSGSFLILPSDEDVHTAVERRLTERIGPLGGKLHTGRSRNDQVATDFRLWVMQAVEQVDTWIEGVQLALLMRAEADRDALLPGYTHLQRAQPIFLSHWWLSHFWPLARDRQRLSELRARAAVMPLGSGALAGCPYPIDRQALAQALGFDAPSPNSLDAVSDRDFAVEFLFAAALTGVHISRMAEMLILYSTAEFGFVTLSDAFSTGSSLMPQKKNPDPLELARGKAGVLIGKLTGLLTTLKGLPSAYDKDLQEDKAPVFEAFDILARVLPVLRGVLSTLTIHPAAMRAAVDPSMLATDLADYLVKKGVPFREAHHLSGQVVRRAQSAGLPAHLLPLEELVSISPVFAGDVSAVFDPVLSANRRAAGGGTAQTAIDEQILLAKQILTEGGSIRILSDP